MHFMVFKNSYTKPLKIVTITSILFFFLLGPNTVAAQQKELDISTSASLNGYIFEVGNLKPGDWMPRNITIINEGKKDFKYTAVVGEKKSIIGKIFGVSKKGLLEVLDLEVREGNKTGNVLYQGKLEDFTGFPPRYLSTGSSETLFFEVRMPYDTGNEYQDASAEVEIKFLAEIVTNGEDDNGGGNDDDSETPGGGNENPPDESGSGDIPPDNGTPDTKTPEEDTPENNTPEDNPVIEQPIEETPNNDPKDIEEPPGISEVPPDVTDNPGDEVINITPEITDNLLPNTATSIYNFIFFGAILLTLGLSILITRFLKSFRRE